ncbi:hypothetical protein GGF32_000021 [Allomyces javanicus]|nr:hypothetical protein GGF32_000021 [Allomyces javanicus]
MASRIRSSTIAGGEKARPDLPGPGGFAPERGGGLGGLGGLQPAGADDDPDEVDEGDDDSPGLGMGGLSKLHRFGGMNNLTSLLAHRPTKDELVSRNILKDDKIAPRLQAAQEELKKKQLEDMLNSKLNQRANVTDLVEHNIIKKDPRECDPALQGPCADLKRALAGDEVARTLRDRSTVDELIAKEILKPEDRPAAV